jgi:hypothetical protein
MFQRELDELEREKRVRVEELRLLEADIRSLDIIIAHVQEARRSALQNVVCAYEKFSPLCQEVNSLREKNTTLFLILLQIWSLVTEP